MTNGRLRGFSRHLALTLRLNLRSPQALVYGYLVPVFFLVAFASIFQSDTPRLKAQMGQLLTISLLGSACFGLPTVLVAERERGVWRRYLLLPSGVGSLLGSVLFSRLILAGSAAALQLVMARAFYQTPWPLHPVQLVIAFLFVMAAFLGLGLVIAALANDVPAVQALGQCLFLPMIMIGGVGVPLAVLPDWAQRIAGFMPGRYAVAALQAAFGEPEGLKLQAFNLAALVVIGASAAGVGLRLFRWEAGTRLRWGERAWVAAALFSWMAVGLAAASTGRLKPLALAGTWERITEAQIAAIDYRGLPRDDEVVTPLAPPFERDPAAAARARDFEGKLAEWPLGHRDDLGQSVRNLLCVASIADLSEDPLEGEIAREVFDELCTQFEPRSLRQALAWVILEPERGTLVMNAPELGFPRRPPDWAIRNRNRLYAQKFLGRLLGKIRD